MELSAEVLHAAVDSIKGDDTERRKHARIPLRFKVKAIPYDSGVLGDPVHVWTRDICAGGIGLIHHKPMREGRKFIIRLPRQDDTPILLLCTVRVCKQVAAAVFNIGASFAEVVESLASDVRELAAGHFRPELALQFVAEAPSAMALTDEIRRISEAILA